MRIDMKRQAEMDKRQGMTKRTVLTVVALLIGFVLAYLLTASLFSRGIINEELVYDQLSLPGELSMGVVRLIVAGLTTFFMWLIILLGFAIASPSARQRSGRPSATSPDPDLYDSKYHYH